MMTKQEALKLAIETMMIRRDQFKCLWKDWQKYGETLAESIEDGCTASSCSMRPLPNMGTWHVTEFSHAGALMLDEEVRRLATENRRLRAVCQGLLECFEGDVPWTEYAKDSAIEVLRGVLRND